MTATPGPVQERRAFGKQGLAGFAGMATLLGQRSCLGGSGEFDSIESLLRDAERVVPIPRL